MSLRVWLPLNGDLHNQGLSDIIVTNNSATVNNNGKIGKCYIIPNVTDLSYSGSNLNTASISLCCWVRFNTADISNILNSQSYTSTYKASNGNILGNNSYGGFSLQWYTNDIYIDGSFSSIKVQCYLRTSTVGAKATTSINLPLDTWNHLCAICDRTTNKCSLYLNGAFQNFFTFNTFTDATDRTFKLNYPATAGGNYYCPIIPILYNDVRIYDHALSAKEVKEIAKGLVLHYKLDDAYSEATTNLCSQLVQGGQMTLANNILTHNGTNSDTYWYIKPKEALVGGATYTISCYLSGFALDTDWIQWGVGAQSGDNNAGHWKTYNGYNSFTFTMPAGKDGSTANFIFDDSNAGTGRSQIFTISNVQLELKDHATPFVEYGQSRPAGVIYDSSGYNNNGTITGVITTINTSVRYNAATYILSGNTDYITTFNTISNPADAITMNIWFKSSCTTPGSNYHEIFNHATNSQYFEFAVYKTGYFRQGITINDTRYVINGGTGLLDGNWHMLTATYNGTEIQRYIDGVLVSSMTQTVSGTLNGANGKFLFGHYGPNTSYYAKEAYLSDARIYATALSADDILELYNTSMSIDKNGNIYARELVEL